MTGGRPLRFLLIVLCGWAAVRGFDLYRRADDPAEVLAPVRSLAAAIGIAPAAAASLPHRPVNGRPPPVLPAVVAHVAPRQPPAAGETAAAQVAAGQENGMPALLSGAPSSAPPPARAAAPPAAPLPQTSRWAGSAWAIVRNGAAIGVPGSQLGGSQAGLRLTYAVTADRRLALAGRLSAPLAGSGREAAVGIDWQPTRLPLHVLAEQRLSLDGGRGGPTVALVGGFGPSAVRRGVVMEGYGQAGVIARDGGQAFADGALRASHPLIATGGLRIDLGAGVWGGVQPQAARLDLGPSLAVVVPVGRQRLRLTADWRQRIAGDSQPGSGPALSIGTNF